MHECMVLCDECYSGLTLPVSHLLIYGRFYFVFGVLF